MTDLKSIIAGEQHLSSLHWYQINREKSVFSFINYLNFIIINLHCVTVNLRLDFTSLAPSLLENILTL